MLLYTTTKKGMDQKCLPLNNGSTWRNGHKLAEDTASSYGNMTTIANDSHNVKASNLRPSNQKAPTSSTKPRVNSTKKNNYVDMEERGKLYGTMKIDQVETPLFIMTPMKIQWFRSISRMLLQKR